MKSDKPSLVIITNLFPLPWQPNRATFNRQQFALLKDDYQVSMLIPVAIGDWFKHRKQIKQTKQVRYVPYFYLPKLGRRFYSVFMFLSLLLHSGFWLKRQKPEIMLASWAFPEGVATSWLSKLFAAKFFFKVHGSDINLHGKIPARAKQIVKASQRARGILSVSQALAKELVSIGVDTNKVKVIYNGVDHDKFGRSSIPPLTHDYLLYVGNLKQDKGVVELLEGFAELAGSYPDLYLVYAGSGIMKDKLLSLATRYQLVDRIKFLGTVAHDDLPAWVSHARILALPSYNEGVPNVVLEAMSCGTAVLATRVGGIPEVLAEHCGCLISAKSSAAVASGLYEMLEQTWDSQLIKEHAQQFSWQRNKRELLAMLSK